MCASHDPRPLFALLCLVGLLAGLTACGSGKITNTGLTVSVPAIEVHADGSAAVTLHFDNPAVYAFNLVRSTHRLYLNGREVATLVIDDPMGLAQQSAADQIVKLPAGKLGAAAGQTSYRLESKLEIRRYGDDLDRAQLANAGTVVITQK